MEAIVLTIFEHRIFTRQWLSHIGRINSKSAVTTANVTKEHIDNAARIIYKDYPEILKALKL